RDVDAEADGVRRHDDVAVEHGGVDAVPAYRLQRQFGGELRLFDRVENAAVAAPSPILGKAAPGLAHEPHRGVRRPLTVGCKDEWRVRHAGGTLSAAGASF